MAERNPFTPSFGVSPPALVGREEALAQVADALDAGPGDPFRAVKVTGLRGSGKTVFLNAVEDAARDRGWAVLSESASATLVERLVGVELPRLLRDLDPDALSRTTTGGSASALGVGASIGQTTESRYRPGDDLRSLLTRLATLQAERGGGVLVTVDELNPAAAEDLREVTQTVQHCFRAGLEVAFVGAGLTLDVSDLMDVPGMTFLRRAEEIRFGTVSDAAVRRGLLDPLQTWGRRIDSDALDVAVAGTRGYPYLIQAVGYHLWAGSTADAPIDVDLAHDAVADALRRVGRLVLAPELRALSVVERSYLDAMALDDGPSRTGEIARRLGRTAQYAGVYRRRLVDAGVIAEAGRGRVDFVLPALRDYLRSAVAAED